MPKANKEAKVAVGVTPPNPITAMRAVIRIESSELADSKFKDSKDRPQKQFACELKAISGAGERDGERFLEWFSFPADGNISPGTKTGQVLAAALGEDATADTLEALAEKLVGKTFAAQIGTSNDGEHPRVKHDTISAATVGDSSDGGSSDEDDSDEDSPDGSPDGSPDEEDFDNIPW